MSIKVGDNFPSGIFRIKGSDGIKEITTENILIIKK